MSRCGKFANWFIWLPHIPAIFLMNWLKNGWYMHIYFLCTQSWTSRYFFTRFLFQLQYNVYTCLHEYGTQPLTLHLHLLYYIIPLLHLILDTDIIIKVVSLAYVTAAHNQRSAPGRECPPGPASPGPGRDWIPGLNSINPGAGRDPGT